MRSESSVAHFDLSGQSTNKSNQKGRPLKGSSFRLLEAGERTAMVADAITLLPSLPSPEVRLQVQESFAGRASLSSLRRPPKRTNRLRHKLLENTRPSNPLPIYEFESSPAGPASEDEPEKLQIVLASPSEELHAEFSESVSTHRNGSVQGDFVGVFLSRSLFLVGFLVLQATIAAWFFSRTNSKATYLDASSSLENGSEGNLLIEEGDVEFKQKVSIIQTMAKEARAVEARKAFANGGSNGREGNILKEVKQKVGKIKKTAGNNRRVSGKTVMETSGAMESQQKNMPEKANHSKSDAVDRLWWLNLSYVMAIFLHRGSDRKNFRGLYSLKFDSNSSFAVVFQDRADATNFSYLLEAFFENLEDFSADVVPLSTKELYDAVRTEALKVIVVKRGQLRLYAGQPLDEAEMQLYSIMK